MATYQCGGAGVELAPRGFESTELNLDIGCSNLTRQGRAIGPQYDPSQDPHPLGSWGFGIPTAADAQAGRSVPGVTAAELDWVNGVIDDLRAGRLTWSREATAEELARFPPLE